LRWNYLEQKKIDGVVLSQFRKNMGLKDYIISALANRGVISFEKAREVFDSGGAAPLPPFLLKGMEEAVSRIKQAIEKNEKIVIYGDYDVDGVTATVILYRFFTEKMKYNNVGYYIPDRLSEGYGINREALDSIKKQDAGLVITVDCGITAGEEVKRAAEGGMDVIITDHHIPDPHSFPKEAAAVLNPKACENYPDKNLSGAGVAYKLACGLAEREKINLGDEYLDFAALGTIADIVPLTGENRVIARGGLKKLEKTDNPGLNALKLVAGLNKAKKLDSYHVGFILGPRINAAGRLEHARRAVELFISDDPGKINSIAVALNETNEERKRMMKKAYEQALKTVEPGFDPNQDFVIVVYDPSWSAGIAGLVASKLAAKFDRPCFVLTKDSGGMARGSARSVAGVDIYSAIKAAEHTLLRFGGHKFAAGVTMEEGKIGNFRKSVNEFLRKNYVLDDFEPVLDIDAKITGALTIKDLRIFDNIQPWGEGNPKPVFSMEKAGVRDVKYYKNNTMKFYAKFGGAFYNFLLFGYGPKHEEKIKKGSELDVAFCPDIDTWQGEERLTLKVKDIK